MQLPKESRTLNKIEPSAFWGWREEYLADIADTLHNWVWMNSKEAKNKSKKPKTVIPDFVLKAQKKGKALQNRKSTSQVAMDIGDLKALLAKGRK